jgi:hypothetical protein
LAVSSVGEESAETEDESTLREESVEEDETDASASEDETETSEEDSEDEECDWVLKHRTKCYLCKTSNGSSLKGKNYRCQLIECRLEEIMSTH